MYYLLEQDPKQKEFIVFQSYDLMEVMDRKLEMECQEHNKFCFYSILELLSVEKRLSAEYERNNKLLSQLKKKL